MATSSHMNQNRSWPGVPKRYSTNSSPKVIRPKSIATVVVFFFSTPDTSSTPRPWSVRTSSVRSGLVSDTAPTSVVLPAPNPPATRILIAVGIFLEGPESIDHRLVHPQVLHVDLRLGFLYGHECPVEQVAEEHPDGATGQVQMRGDLGHGHHRLAEPDDGQMLGAEADLHDRSGPCRLDQGDEVELATDRLEPAAGHH